MFYNIISVIARSDFQRRSNLSKKDCRGKQTASLAMTLFLFSFILLPQLRAETIHYSIRQMGFDGEATLSMVGPKDYKDHKTLLIVFKANGVNFSDEEDIYVDPSTYKPLFVERDFSLNVFGKGKTLEEYLPSKGEILVTKTEGNRVSQQVIKKAGNVDNIYGFIFRYRKEGSFKMGDVLNMVLPTRDLKIKLVNRQEFKTGGKTYDSYYMQSQPTRYKIWFDSSEHKWPLQITGTIGFINSVMTMTGYDE